ncbi:MAG: hypothetical protein ACRD21_26795, partial [Vicinamibacteria bacterium]
MDERLTARGKHRRRGLTVLIALICLLSSLAFGFRPDVYPLQAGIDASYMFAANYASVRGLRWGQDFVSTFGPYVYLIQAVDLGSIPFKKLVSEFLFLLLAGLACTLYIASRRPIETKGAVFLAVLLPYAVHLQGGEQRWFAVLVVLLLVGVTAPRLIGLASFSAASLLAGFFLLVKLSLGVGGVLSILAGCILTERPR